MKFSCNDCSAANLCLPAGLSADELERLTPAIMRQKVIEKGDILAQQGQKFQYITAVRSGSFKTYALSPSGQQRILGFFFKGDLLGLEAIHPQHYPYTIEALSTASICQLDFQKLLTLSQQLPELNKQLIMTISREMAPQTQPASPGQQADQRLAAFVLSLSERMKARGYSSQKLHLSMSRQDIAHYLGLTIETVSRSFSKLEKQALIEIKHRDLNIKNIENLQAKAVGDYN